MVFLAATAMLALFSLMTDLTLNVDILIEILGLDQTGNKNKNKSKSEKLLKISLPGIRISPGTVKTWVSLKNKTILKKSVRN